jgi:hypothetical protein
MFVVIFGYASAVVVAIGTINNDVKTKDMQHTPIVCMHCDYHGDYTSSYEPRASSR